MNINTNQTHPEPPSMIQASALTDLTYVIVLPQNLNTNIPTDT
jgi:hypothetical protein